MPNTRPDPASRPRVTNGTVRHVNDTIRDLAERSASEEAWEFVCECDDPACLELVELTLAEFDGHRDGERPRPVLARRHHAG
jgi:hypothetical protein